MVKKNKAFISFLIIAICLMINVLVGCSLLEHTQQSHIHSFSTEWVSNATHHWQACSGCNEIRFKEEHDWNQGVITTPATEASEGVKTYTCETCGKTKTEAIDKLTHTHSFLQENAIDKYLASEATCTSPATYYYSCSCGEKSTDTFRYGEPLGHSFANYINDHNATCTTNGTKTAKCERCDATNTIENPGSALGHTYSTSWTTDDNYHWHAATCEHTNEVSDKEEHEWGNAVILKQATEDEEGLARYTCSICKITKEEVILPKGKVSVVFKDYDGTILKQLQIYEGEYVEAPEDPEREGYRFDKWDKPFINVYSNLIVTAQYVKTYIVNFIDFDGLILETQIVDAGLNALAPSSPQRTNYKFNGWDKSFTNVQSDLNVNATYIAQYTVKFIDLEENILGVYYVDEGSTLSEYPVAPSIEGYTFVSWSDNLEIINSNIVVRPNYEVSTYKVRFLKPNGTLIDEQQVAYGFDAIPPQVDQYMFNWSSMAAYEFSSWNKNYTNIKSDLDVVAQYSSSPINKPIIVVDTEAYHQIEQGNTTLTVRVYLINAVSLYGIDLKLEFDELFTMDSCTVKIASQAASEASKIDNEKHTYELTWTNGVVASVGNSVEVLEAKFYIPYRPDLGTYHINVSSDTYYVSGSVEKVFPMIMSGTIEIIAKGEN